MLQQKVGMTKREIDARKILEGVVEELGGKLERVRGRCFFHSR